LPRHAAGAFAARVDPGAHALLHLHVPEAFLHLRWRPESFDRYDFLHCFGKNAGIEKCDGTAEGMSNDGDGSHLFLMHKLSNVVDVVDLAVAAARRPVAVAVAAQVRCDNVIAIAQAFGDPVPIPAMIPSAMYHQEVGRTLVAPVDIVEA